MGGGGGEHVCIYTYVYIYIYIHTYVFTYIYICTYTHTRFAQTSFARKGKRFNPPPASYVPGPCKLPAVQTWPSSLGLLSPPSRATDHFWVYIAAADLWNISCSPTPSIRPDSFGGLLHVFRTQSTAPVSGDPCINDDLILNTRGGPRQA